MVSLSTCQLDTIIQGISSSPSTTQLTASLSLNILWLSFTKNANRKFHVSAAAKSALILLGVLCFLCQFFPHSHMVAPCWGPRPRPPLYGFDRCTTSEHQFFSFKCVQSVIVGQRVASPATCHCYFHGYCCCELAPCIHSTSSRCARLPLTTNSAPAF